MSTGTRLANAAMTGTAANRRAARRSTSPGIVTLAGRYFSVGGHNLRSHAGTAIAATLRRTTAGSLTATAGLGRLTAGNGTCTMPGSRGKSGVFADGGAAVAFRGCAGGAACGFAVGSAGGAAGGFATGFSGGAGDFAGAVGSLGGAVGVGFAAGFFTGVLAGAGTIMMLPHAPQRTFRPASCASTTSTWPEGQTMRKIIYSGPLSPGRGLSQVPSPAGKGLSLVPSPSGKGLG